MQSVRSFWIWNSKKVAAVLLGATVSLGACTPYQKEQIKNLGQPPAIDTIGNPVLARQQNPVEWLGPIDADQPSMSNSLWRPGASTFFEDKRARKVGDILKVMVSINDKAELDNKTVRERKTAEEGGAPIAFGLEKLATGWAPGKADPTDLFTIDMSNNSEGNGTIDRGEVVETQIAAMVTQIFPDGNLLIHGSQEIRVNHELRKITVDGIVRPEDITVENAIESNQIAEARISYGGKGNISELQQPRIGHQIIELLSPF